jgi:hypothetical protein
LSVSFSHLPTPAEASSPTLEPCQSFAQAGNRRPLLRDTL